MATSKEERQRKAKSMGSAPSIVVSGPLTKRTRSMNRWVKRWWQLLDNGMLIYFKSDDRVKLLGEIDIGRTCYDVRLGAQHCKIQFPRVVPPACCFAVSVLKRTYYFYASEPAEARQWAEQITSLSAVLNRRRLVSRQAPKPPTTLNGTQGAAGSRQVVFRNTRTSDGVHARHSVAVIPQDASKFDQELRDEHRELPVFRPRKSQPAALQSPQVLSLSQPPSSTPVHLQSHPRYKHGSLPSSLDQLSLYSYPYSNGSTGLCFTPNSSQAMTPAGVVLRTHVNSPRLKMTRTGSFGSGDEGSAFQCSDSNVRSRSRSEAEEHRSDEFESFLTQSHPPRMTSRQSLPVMVVPSSYMQLGEELQRLQEREAILRRKLAAMDDPPRPVSVGNYHPGSLPCLTKPSSRANQSLFGMPSSSGSPSSSDVGSSNDPSPQILRKRPGLGKGHPPPPVMPKPILKRPGYSTYDHLAPLEPPVVSKATDGNTTDVSTVSAHDLHDSARASEQSDRVVTSATDVSDLSSAGAGDASQQSQSSHSSTSPKQTSPSKPQAGAGRYKASHPALPSYPPPLLPAPRHSPPPPAPLQNGALSPLSPHSPGKPSSHSPKSADSARVARGFVPKPANSARELTNRNQLQTVSSARLLLQQLSMYIQCVCTL